MNINQSALKLYLDGLLPQELIRYFTKDYAQVISKIEQFKKKNSKTPSLDFLIQYSSKLGEDREQSNRIEDLLYVVSKIKTSEMSVDEISELFLGEYKSDMIRDLIKRSSQAVVEDNIGLVEKLSKEISAISSLSLGGNNFLAEDIKVDVKNVSTKLEFISTGLFNDYDFPAINKTPRGSLILILGSTGVGKSLTTIISNVETYLSGKNVIYISNEMAKSQVLARVKAYISKTPYTEIVDNNYLTDEGRLKVLASEVVLEREITLDKAYKHLLKDENYDFSDYKIRSNYFKIMAANDAGEFIRRKSQGLPIEELPTDEDILNMVRNYGDTLDLISIDLLAEVAFKDAYANKEQQMSKFGREFKELLLLTATNGIIVSQPENEKSASGLRYPKYCKHLRTTCDMSIILCRTQELKKMGCIAVSVDKNRNNKGETSYICSAEYEVMDFVPTGDVCTLDELLNEVSKENKNNGEKK